MAAFADSFFEPPAGG